MLNSPFKFLDAYKKEDKELFFGRDEEVKLLYNAINTTKLLMVYGASGTGKTSMIECGLRNQFSALDWEALSIRRNQHIYASFFEQINLLLSEKKKISLTKNKEGILMPENPEMNLANAVKILYQSKFKPIYLLFDQFEELLILGKEPEKAQFFEELQQLLETKTPCRVILILREEFIGHLSEYENLVPSLFRHRFRVEKMNKTKVAQVIEHTLQAAAKFEPPFDVQDSNKLTQAILNNLPDDSREIELVHLQVYLDKLWKRDYQHAQSAKRPVCLTAALIAKEDKLQRILGEFLEEQLATLTQNDKRLLPLELLISMITQEGTKLQRTEHEIIQRLTHNEIDFATSEIPPIIQHLVQNRILRVLKAGDITRYELSHDLLAQIVKSMLTQEMELREKAADIYAVYQEREGFFSQEDLDYMRPYQVYKNYPADLKKRIEDSETHIANEKATQAAKARRQILVLSSLLGVVLIALVIAGYYYFDAKENQRKATDQTALAIQQRNEADSLRIRSDSMLIQIARQTGIILQEKKNTENALAETEVQRTEAENQKIAAQNNAAEAKKQKEEAERKKKEAEENLRKFHQAEYESMKKKIAAYRYIGNENAAQKQEQATQQYYQQYKQYLKQ